MMQYEVVGNQVPAVISGVGGGMALGQAISVPVTTQEVKDYLRDQGYELDVPVVEPVVPVVPEVAYLSKWEAIAIATDMALEMTWYAPEAYTIPYTAGHRHFCPGYPYEACKVPEAVWVALLLWNRDSANGFLAGRYGLPDWYPQITGEYRQPPGLTGLSGAPNLGASWIEENPWVITWIGDGIAAYGQHLTAKNVTDEIKKAMPKGFVTSEDLAALTLALTQKVPQEQAGIVAAGVQGARMPSWLLPALLAGGGVLVYLLVAKK